MLTAGRLISHLIMAISKSEAGKDVERGEIIDMPFEGILNFRDAGKNINEFLGQKCARP